MITVVLLDDHPLIRQGIRSVLDEEEDISVIAELEEPRQVEQALTDNTPDVLVTDLLFNQDMSGFDVIRLVKKRFPLCRLLVVSMHSELVQIQKALRSGADGFIPKENSPTMIAKAIRWIFQGESFLPSEMLRSGAVFTDADSHNSALDVNIYEVLSSRESEIFELLGKGETSRDIAEKLHISQSTLATHRDRIKSKLGIDSLVQLRFAATQWVMKHS